MKHFIIVWYPGVIYPKKVEIPVAKKPTPDEAKKIAEDYPSKRKAYCFTIAEQSERDPQTQRIKTCVSGFHYLGGTVKTLAQLQMANDPEFKVLIQNMQNGPYLSAIQTNYGSWCMFDSTRDVVL